jgi:prepilin-type N-terminal cleavage/methylation domain-containing protein
MRSEKGFSLVEVLTATMLLGIIGVALLNGLSTASRVLFLTDEHQTALTLAQHQMEYVNSANFSTSYEYEAIIPSEYYDAGYDATITADPIAEGDGNIQKIKVFIYHQGKLIILAPDSTLEGYKVRP